MATEQQHGKHHRRRRLVARYWDECVDALYSPLGQRAARLFLAAAAVLLVNVAVLVLLIIRVL